MDYYKVLKITPEATREEIELAAERMFTVWDPDEFDQEFSDIAEKVLGQVVEATSVLLDPSRKRSYDRKRREGLVDIPEAASGYGYMGKEYRWQGTAFYGLTESEDGSDATDFADYDRTTSAVEATASEEASDGKIPSISEVGGKLEANSQQNLATWNQDGTAGVTDNVASGNLDGKDAKEFQDDCLIDLIDANSVSNRTLCDEIKELARSMATWEKKHDALEKQDESDLNLHEDNVRTVTSEDYYADDELSSFSSENGLGKRKANLQGFNGPPLLRGLYFKIPGPSGSGRDKTCSLDEVLPNHLPVSGANDDSNEEVDSLTPLLSATEEDYRPENNKEDVFSRKHEPSDSMLVKYYRMRDGRNIYVNREIAEGNEDSDDDVTGENYGGPRAQKSTSDHELLSFKEVERKPRAPISPTKKVPWRKSNTNEGSVSVQSRTARRTFSSPVHGRVSRDSLVWSVPKRRACSDICVAGCKTSSTPKSTDEDREDNDVCNTQCQRVKGGSGTAKTDDARRRDSPEFPPVEDLSVSSNKHGSPKLGSSSSSCTLQGACSSNGCIPEAENSSGTFDFTKNVQNDTEQFEASSTSTDHRVVAKSELPKRNNTGNTTCGSGTAKTDDARRRDSPEFPAVEDLSVSSNKRGSEKLGSSSSSCTLKGACSSNGCIPEAENSSGTFDFTKNVQNDAEQSEASSTSTDHQVVAKSELLERNTTEGPVDVENIPKTELSQNIQRSSNENPKQVNGKTNTDDCSLAGKSEERMRKTATDLCLLADVEASGKFLGKGTTSSNTGRLEAGLERVDGKVVTADGLSSSLLGTNDHMTDGQRPKTNLFLLCHHEDTAVEEDNNGGQLERNNNNGLSFGSNEEKSISQEISSVKVRNVKFLRLKDGGGILKCETWLDASRQPNDLDVANVAAKVRAASKTTYAEQGRWKMLTSRLRLGQDLEMTTVYKFSRDSGEEESLEVYLEGHLVCSMDKSGVFESGAIGDYFWQEGLDTARMTVVIRANGTALRIARTRQGATEAVEIFKEGRLLYFLENKIAD